MIFMVHYIKHRLKYRHGFARKYGTEGQRHLQLAEKNFCLNLV